MRVFDFQLKGLTRDDLMRRRNQGRTQHSVLMERSRPFGFLKTLWIKSSPAAHGVVWAIVLLTSLFGLNWIYATAENHPASVYRRLVLGASNVIVLPDNSGSMEDKKPRLVALIDQLRKRGVNADNQFPTDGGGFSSEGPSNNSLKQLEAALETNPGADAIFVFSDFSDGNYPADVHDEAGFQRLRRLVLARPRHLYLGTVDKQPPQELIEIARQSGGGMFVVSR